MRTQPEHLLLHVENAKKIGSAGACNTTSDPNRNDTVKERRMADNANIPTSGDSATNSTSTWKSLGELARALAEKAGRK